jgi:long-chain acyl-CoA synthetase
MEIRTLCDLFYYSVDMRHKAEHLRFKRDGAWRALSSDQLRVAVEELSMGLRELGVETGDRVAILSENRPEWALADFASLTAAAIDVPLYASLTPPQVLYILNDSEARVVFVANVLQARKVAEIRPQAKALEHVIRMEDGPGFPEGTLSLDEVRARGRAALGRDKDAVRARAALPRPEDVATLIYTSGTTGDPKGVMLTHDNLVSNVKGSLGTFRGVGPDDTALSFLPLCHVFERMGGHYLMLYIGATIAYAESVDLVPANMMELRPTIMLSVPRLYEKMYARVHEKVAADPPLRQRIFRWALGIGRRGFRCRLEKTPPSLALRLQLALAERLVFAKIKARTGGRLRVFVSGGAPLALEIAQFFGAVGLPILEGYGLTETSPVIAVNTLEALRPGTVGRPIPGVEVKIGADGEILTRGPHVMKGYYREPKATAEAIDSGGWLHTGDVGHLDEDGFLVITDRKKDIIVTSGGKNIAPQPIENALKTHPLIAEVVMIGNRRSFPSALLVPNFDNLEKWARGSGLPYASREDLVGRPEVQALYERTIGELTPSLARFEQIKKVAVLPREFSLEAGELTPTLKVKRRFVEQKYKDLIDRLYEGTAA